MNIKLPYNIKEAVLSVLKNYPVEHAGVFGSYARGEQTKKSDLDLFIDFKKGASLFDIVGIKNDLTDKLNLSVDVISKRSKIHHIVLQNILKDLIPIL
jgi:predicted nucleotidyltransferase